MKEGSILGTKEIAKYEKEISSIQDYAGSLEVTSEDSYKEALNEGKQIKTQLDAIIARKEEITKPLNATLKSVRDLFRPFEERGESALRVIKDKMLSFSKEQTRKAEEAKQKLAERVERGTMKPETAVRKIEEMKAPEKTIATDEGKATTRTVKKYRVVDMKKVPLEFMEVNMTLVRNAFRAGKPVLGCEEYEETELSLG